MSGQGTIRASQRTAAEETAHVDAAELEKPLESLTDVERRKLFDLTGFSRIRTDWRSDEADRLRRVERQTEDILIDRFWSLYAIRQGLFEQVREPVVDDDGVIEVDRHGLTRFLKDHTGLYVEDWSQLTDKDARNFLYKIVAHLFEWEQTAEHLRSQAMYAKSVYEEMFAARFDEQPPAGQGSKPTDASREQNAKRRTAEERLFALYVTGLSRQADALVRGMDRLQRTMKDLLPQR